MEDTNSNYGISPHEYYDEYYDESNYTSFNETYLDIFDEHLTYRNIARGLLLYIAPFLIILGCFGNAMSFIVLQSPLFRSTPCGYLLSALAVVDTGVLLTGLLRLWIFDIAGVDIRTTSEAACKALIFFGYAFPQISSWTLVLVTADRTVSVAAPLRSKEICTFWRMFSAWLIMVGVVTLINIYPMVEYTIVIHLMTIRSCAPLEDRSQFFTTAFSWIDFLFMALIPMLIILSCNIFIVIMLQKADKRRQNLSVRGRGTQSSNRRSVRNMRSVNVMLVILGIAFLVTTTPRSIYFLTLQVAPEHDTSKRALIMNASLLIYNSSNAFNFVLYCVSGSRFRLAMKMMFCSREYNRRRSSAGINMSKDSTNKRRSSEGQTSQTQVSSLL